MSACEVLFAKLRRRSGLFLQSVVSRSRRGESARGAGCQVGGPLSPNGCRERSCLRTPSPAAWALSVGGRGRFVARRRRLRLPPGLQTARLPRPQVARRRRSSFPSRRSFSEPLPGPITASFANGERQDLCALRNPSMAPSRSRFAGALPFIGFRSHRGTIQARTDRRSPRLQSDA